MHQKFGEMIGLVHAHENAIVRGNLEQYHIHFTGSGERQTLYSSIPLEL